MSELKKMKNFIAPLLFVFLGAVLAYIFMVRPAREDRDELASLLDSTIYEFASYRNESNQEILTQKQVIASLENAVAAGLITQKELKEHNLKQIQQIVRLKAEVKRLNLEMDFSDDPEIKIVYVDSVNYDSYLKIPQQFFFKDEWTDIIGTIHSQGVRLDSLSIKVETDILTGYQRSGFLKSEPVVIVKHFNPYMSGTAVENITIKEKPPWYNRPNFYRLQGIVGLYGIIKLTKLLN